MFGVVSVFKCVFVGPFDGWLCYFIVACLIFHLKNTLFSYPLSIFAIRHRSQCTVVWLPVAVDFLAFVSRMVIR